MRGRKFSALKKIFGQAVVISKKGKRKITVNGKIYFWFVTINEKGHRIHILTEDKKVNREFPFMDTEVPVTPQEVAHLIKEYLQD